MPTRKRRSLLANTILIIAITVFAFFYIIGITVFIGLLDYLTPDTRITLTDITIPTGIIIALAVLGWLYALPALLAYISRKTQETRPWRARKRRRRSRRKERKDLEGTVPAEEALKAAKGGKKR